MGYDFAFENPRHGRYDLGHESLVADVIGTAPKRTP